MSVVSSTVSTREFPSELDAFSDKLCQEEFTPYTEEEPSITRSQSIKPRHVKLSPSNETDFPLNRSQSLIKPRHSTRRLKSLDIKRRLTLNNLEAPEHEKLMKKLSVENNKYVASQTDSTGFLLARLEKTENSIHNSISENVPTSLPKANPIFKTEIGPEELSANYVPTMLPPDYRESPFSSDSDISHSPNSVTSGGSVLDVDELESITSIYESLPDWEFWCTTVQDYSGVARRTPHLLSNKIRLGIPSVLRGTLWQTMSQSSSTYLETVYNQLLEEKDFVYEKIIQRDIPRTFPRLPMFSKEGGVGQTRLFNVLKAYSLYDTEVGYCQGLGFMVGPLLMNLPELEAFAVFIRLMETYDMRTMFTVKMEGLRLRLYQLGHLISELLPDLANHLASYNISTALYASQWFLSLFAYTFPLTLVQRIYDVVFAEGAPETIMRIALALLKKNEATLLAMTEFEEIISFLSSAQLFEAYNSSATKLISDAIALSSQVTRKKLEELAVAYSKEPNSDIFCKQKTSVTRKLGWVNDILSSLSFDGNISSRSSSRSDYHSLVTPSFFMNPENSTAPRQLRRKPSDAPSVPDTEVEVLRHAVHDLQTSAESHLTALTQLRQDHVQLKNEAVHLKSDKFNLQEENEVLRQELNKVRQEGLDFQRQSRSTLLRQQEYIQAVEKQLLDANLRLKNLQDERDQLESQLDQSRQTSSTVTGSPMMHSNLSGVFRRFITKS